MPKVGIIYHCPVCHLEVTFDAALQKMTPVPQSNGPEKPHAR